MTGLGYTLPAVLAVIAVCVAGARRVAHRAVPPGGLLDLDGDRVRLPDPRRRLADQAVRAHRHLRRAAHQRASGFRSTSPSRISCSASRWSPRCCCCGSGSGCATAGAGAVSVEPAACRARGARGVRRGRRGVRRAGRRSTPAITRICGFRPRRMRIAGPAAGVCGCSTRAAAPVPPPPRCWPSPRRPRSWPWTRRRACWPRPRRNAGRRRCGSCTAASRISPTPGVDGPFDGILAAYLLRNLRRSRRTAAPFRAAVAAGRDARRARILGARLAVRDGRCGTRCARRHHPGGPAAHRRRRALPVPATQRERLRRRRSSSGNRLRANGFTAVRSETMPGWQRNIVHTFLADAPR